MNQRKAAKLHTARLQRERTGTRTASFLTVDEEGDPRFSGQRYELDRCRSGSDKCADLSVSGDSSILDYLESIRCCCLKSLLGDKHTLASFPDVLWREDIYDQKDGEMKTWLDLTEKEADSYTETRRLTGRNGGPDHNFYTRQRVYMLCVDQRNLISAQAAI